MNNIILSRTASIVRARLAVQPHLCHSVRYVSLNTAINRGLRQSKGVGFRGRRRSQSEDIESNLTRISSSRISGKDASNNPSLEKIRDQLRRRADDASSVKIRKGKKVIRDDEEWPRRRSRAARFYDPNSSFGKKSIVYQRKLADGEIRADSFSAKDTRRTPDWGIHKRLPAEDRPQRLSGKESGQYHGREDTTATQKSSERDRRRLSQQSADASSAIAPRFSKTADNRIPVSIPYTTPASEFLYGTSVVEAALRSNRVPRRKLYKLYIYTGENRDRVDRDAGIEQLARKVGVEVVHAGPDLLRVMEKMSGGRPHNGYILEASPLPKLPVTSLGELVKNEDMITGFEVELDHQSREDAAINGTDNFIPYRPNVTGRKPFVLLLDSIEEPGNLGGIIRTASFLGVTAVAISTRSSAPFTPVVLKASAGASETVTLFSVSKPAGFVANSKLAGWKVYAAVAPSPDTSSRVVNITTAELEDPLSNDPCLLIFGNEGEGIRWNLRSKADVEIAIQGTAQKHTVNSLNVSVAAGILCDAFLRRRDKAKHGQLAEKAERQLNSTSTGGDLF
ncbi:hypothetical protein F5884DRAFT_766484 [Xylogone sp. PMI_703]|nr:hypothetical protein F5884DRAFT_766484 [Xylogone sp. PMI_703]